MSAFDLDLVRQAAIALAPHVVRTPLLSSPILDGELGFNLFVKAEGLQTTGSFKLRGALNKLLAMKEEDRRRGVITFSAGNHGQAVAAASRFLGCNATIVLPKTAPSVKVDNCRWWGAEVVFYDPQTEDRRIVTQRVIDQWGLTLVHPFDDHHVMAGQGTAGLEIVTQLGERGLTPDAVVVNCSGGGLASGVTLAVRSAFPRVPVYLTEIAGFQKWKRSLASGVPEESNPVAHTIIDGINGPMVGSRPLEALLAQSDVQSWPVTDEEALGGMRAAFRHLKIVLEPAGAAGLAAVMREKSAFARKNVVVVASGSNVDPSIFARVVN